ncbi:SubName: Full=Uncharacterized protein {ECO:0000313/EMBL:CCA68596.1} [Serendipita indica DSM 11827]|nr:SubName: Full=Uncharacterized protein {ECO:0000313/EMBL:CCA68596.1} [Serendipita indica DSM 11827]
MSALGTLANPPLALVDGAMFDYFLMEMVATIRQSSVVASQRQKQLEDEMANANLLQHSQHRSGHQQLTEDALRARLDNIGAQVGASLVEKSVSFGHVYSTLNDYLFRLSKDRQRFTDTLDSVKFICKDIWMAVWDKQGVYVLQDNAFRPLMRISSPEGGADALAKAKIYLAFHAGVLRGALARLGLQGTVTPEVTSLPQCIFQIKLPRV